MSLRTVPTAYATEGQGAAPLCAAILGGAFKRVGLDVTVHKTGDAGGVSDGLANGEILFGNLAVPNLVHAISRGAPLAFIAGGVNQQFLVARPGIESLGQLKGARFGASRPNDLTEFILDYTIQRALDGEGTVVPIGDNYARLDALLAGQIDASPFSVPVAVHARRGGCTWVLDYAEYDLNYAIGGIAARRDLLKNEPELVETFLRGYLEGLRQYKTNRDFGIEVHEWYAKVPADVAAESYDTTHAGFPDVPDPNTKGLKILIDFWRERGVVDPDLTVEKVVDSGPVLAVCAVPG